MKIVQKITSPLDCPAFIAAHRQNPQDFTRRRQLTFKNLVLFLLNQPRTALQTELDQFYRVLNQASTETQMVTAQAFCKARKKLNPEVFESLNRLLQQQIDCFGLRQKWRGLRVLAVDGSTVHLPLESTMATFFGSHSGFPMARLSTLYEVADGQTLHSLIVPLTVGERDCAHLHLEHLPADSLTLFDRGYPGHWLFALFAQQQRHFLMRLPCGYNAQVKAFLHSGQVEDTQLFVANHPEARLFCSEAGVDPASQIELRLIRVELANGESEVLLTSLLDREAFPAEVFAELYHRRWGIETDSFHCLCGCRAELVALDQRSAGSQPWITRVGLVHTRLRASPLGQPANNTPPAPAEANPSTRVSTAALIGNQRASAYPAA